MISYPILMGLIFFLNNKPIDSANNTLNDWAIYQILPKPVLPEHNGFLLKYAFDKMNEWKFYEEDIVSDKINRYVNNDSLSTFGKNFYKFIQGRTKYGYILYNDKTPNGIDGYSLSKKSNTEKFGYGKGVLIWDDQTITYILHSVPKYPLPFESEKYEFPEIEKNFGQNFLFLFLQRKNNDNDNLLTIMKHLIILNARIYEHNFLLKDDDILKAAETELYGQNGKTISTYMIHSNSVANLISLKGTKIKIITKSSSESDEIWKKISGNFANAKLHIKSYPALPGLSFTSKNYFIKILDFKIKKDNAFGLSHDLPEWNYINDKSIFAVGDNLYCHVSFSNKILSNNLKKAGMAICLHGSNIKIISEVIIKSILKSK